LWFSLRWRFGWCCAGKGTPKAPFKNQGKPVLSGSEQSTLGTGPY
jgi:hypothetical protein